MDLKASGITRAALRQGSQGPGGGVGDDHFEEMVGSRDFFVYVTPNKRPKGYAELKAFLEGQGCQVRKATDAPLLPGKRYDAFKVTFQAGSIPDGALRKAHRWAHQRNFLHSFFKPYSNANV